ncbi:CopG family transcriptional regulator [Paenibacillus sp. FSL H7-0942]|uniref:CopG family transcriptional regulator n=1 Tax=Paenibacillus TaxID=44249 RepID=UPI00096E627E|nr:MULTISPECIES: CopG family transcriptional regulator [Paenibacillus]OME97829.1 CopG family transcriptional regulator [Paenibacillus amylolyticus]
MDNIDKTEKITINIGVVDLGHIDLLVEQGFYSNRTDFIKTSVRNQISTHQQYIQHEISSKVLAAGVVHYNQSDLVELYNKNQSLEIRLIGMLILDPDVTPEAIYKTVKVAKIFGVIKASPQVKAALEAIKKK